MPCAGGVHVAGAHAVGGDGRVGRAGVLGRLRGRGLPVVGGGARRAAARPVAGAAVLGVLVGHRAVGVQGALVRVRGLGAVVHQSAL